MLIPAMLAAHRTHLAAAETGATQHHSVTAGKKAHPCLASAEPLTKPGRAANRSLPTCMGKNHTCAIGLLCVGGPRELDTLESINPRVERGTWHATQQQQGYS